MSPEQFKGEKVDCRSDIYSTGALLYQVLTGEPPFRRADLPGLMYEHMTVAPTPPVEKRREIPDSLSAAIVKALAKAPIDRFQTAAEFLAAISGDSGFDSVNLSIASTPPAATPDYDDVVATQPVAGVQPRKTELAPAVNADADFVTSHPVPLPEAIGARAEAGVGMASAVSAHGVVAVAHGSLTPAAPGIGTALYVVGLLIYVVLVLTVFVEQYF
jgi:serine/threonine protein kinase